ncbi:MAG: phytoene desaturase family protein [Acidimicrobiales bacterium]
MADPDAVVIGSGPNGLVCANLLADEGWDVLVLEAGPTPGGAVSSAGYLGPGFVADVCSAFYPLAAASPVVQALGLEHHGLRWRHAPTVLAHPTLDGRAAVLYRDVEATADALASFGRGDGDAWKRLWELWQQAGGPLVESLLGPFPPVRGAARLTARLGTAGTLRFARFATMPVRRLAEEEFSGIGGPLLLFGGALHTDLSPESAGSSVFGWLLAMLGHEVGYPVPEGGAGQLAAAMVARLESRGGRLRCASPVARVVVRGGRAAGVVTAAGEEVHARRAVVADVAAPQLYGELIPAGEVPSQLRLDIGRFQWDYSTVKVDWALRAPVPWAAPEVSGAGTVHLSDSLDDMTQYCADIAMQRVPARPFVLIGQMTTADPSRSPAGTEVLWAYTHVPRQVRGDAGGGEISGRWDGADREAMTARIEATIERHAPGFGALVTARHEMFPGDLEAHDGNLVGGAVNGGTSALHQQLVFRPVPGLGRAETPFRGLYLASSSAHPGGGVHGACGANAARAAISAHTRLGRAVVSPLVRAAGKLARGY